MTSENIHVETHIPHRLIQLLLLHVRNVGSIISSVEMRVVTACVIGGYSLSGGEGTILGAFLGVPLMALVRNAFNLLGVSVYWQTTAMGSILLMAVLMDVLRRRVE